MEVVELENIIIENSVIIRGLTNTEIDEDLTEFLNKYGHVHRHIRIDNPKSPYHKEVIVEYSSCSALVTVSVADNLTDSSRMVNPSSSDIPFPPKQADYSGEHNSDTVHRVVTGNVSPTIEAKDVNPPEVQRIVVEHIVKSDCISPSNASFRLRVFSGKVPRPTGEVDYDTWRKSVELILQDPSLSDLHRSRRILDSLLPPASEIVKQLGAKALPVAYLDILDSAFDAVEDGDDLFAKFLNMLQKHK
ncbi:zinc finger CCHC domain-containing protein 18-like [Tachysurus ichikawai]